MPNVIDSSIGNAFLRLFLRATEPDAQLLVIIPDWLSLFQGWMKTALLFMVNKGLMPFVNPIYQILRKATPRTCLGTCGFLENVNRHKGMLAHPLTRCPIL